MTGIGPVEPTNAPDTAPSYDVIGTDFPRLTDRWHTLAPRVRRSVLAAAAATAAATITTAVLLLPKHSSPALPAEPPSPWPATVTAFRYAGVVSKTAATPSPYADFRFDVTVQYGPPVTVYGITPAFAGLHARTTPHASFTVHAGTTHRIMVRISVTECSGLPLDAEFPFFDVTLRNTHAIQHQSFIFDGPYSRDLSRLLHATCDGA